MLQLIQNCKWSEVLKLVWIMLNDLNLTSGLQRKLPETTTKWRDDHKFIEKEKVRWLQKNTSYFISVSISLETALRFGRHEAVFFEWLMGRSYRSIKRRRPQEQKKTTLKAPKIQVPYLSSVSCWIADSFSQFPNFRLTVSHTCHKSSPFVVSQTNSYMFTGDEKAVKMFTKVGVLLTKLHLIDQFVG